MQNVCLDSYISSYLCFLNTPRLHKSNCTINIDLVVLDTHDCRQHHKMHNGLTLRLKFYFEKKNELIYDIYTFENILLDKAIV